MDAKITRIRLALVGYACLAFLMLCAYSGITLMWVGVGRVRKTVLPCFFLIEMVYSAFLFVTGFRIYSLLTTLDAHSTNPISIAIMASGLLLFVAGLAGLLAHSRSKPSLEAAALMIVTLANIAFLVLGLLTLFDVELVEQFLGDNWPSISAASRGNLSPQDYVRRGRLNFKFAGLCYLSFFLVSVPLTVSGAWQLARKDVL